MGRPRLEMSSVLRGLAPQESGRQLPMSLSLCERLEACVLLGMGPEECVLASLVPDLPMADEPHLYRGVWVNRRHVWGLAAAQATWAAVELSEAILDLEWATLQGSDSYKRFSLARALWEMEVVLTVAEYAARRWAQEPDWEKDEYGIQW